jgi:hypothetical protein
MSDFKDFSLLTRTYEMSVTIIVTVTVEERKYNMSHVPALRHVKDPSGFL